jgi:predicted dehydrogenase
MIRQGQLGRINKVVVEYPQGWLSGMLDRKDTAISMWRMDPAAAGGSCCMADIGTHAENLVRYMTGLEIDELCAELTSFIPGNKLDDDGNVLIRYKGGAKGVLYASQISTGEENGLRIRIYGTALGLEWRQEDPNYLIVKDPRGIRTIYSKGNPNLCAEARNAGRLPFGHPDGFIEAFANLYLEGYRAMEGLLEGTRVAGADFPTVYDGVTGMRFVETVLESSRAGGVWTRMKQ